MPQPSKWEEEVVAATQWPGGVGGSVGWKTAGKKWHHSLDREEELSEEKGGGGEE